MRMKLEDMSPALKERVEEALARQSRKCVSGRRVEKGAMMSSGDGVNGRGLVAAKLRRGPNKTEAEYNRLHLHGKGMYEAVTLRLPGGSRYTPDWVVIGEGGAVELHEVKGPYRFGSHGRAATAFREAVAAFPCFAFVWAVRGKGGAWSVRRQAAGGEGGSLSGGICACRHTHGFFTGPNPSPFP